MGAVPTVSWVSVFVLSVLLDYLVRPKVVVWYEWTKSSSLDAQARSTPPLPPSLHIQLSQSLPRARSRFTRSKDLSPQVRQEEPRPLTGRVRGERGEQKVVRGAYEGVLWVWDEGAEESGV